MLTRREFIKTGVAGSVLLACAGVVARVARAEQRVVPLRAPEHEFLVLDAASRDVIAALAPVILKGTLPEDSAKRRIAVAETVAGVDRAIAGLPPAVQKEVDQLFTLLTLAPTRMLVVGVWKPWGEASEAELAAFLTRWRESRIDLLHTGYRALKDLTAAVWYGNPLAWSEIGYAGPPRLVA